MRTWVIAALGAFACTAALADYLDQPPLFDCDAAASRVAIWFEPQDAPPGIAGAPLRVPPSGTSAALSPSGYPYRAPGRVRVQRCGRLQLRLAMAFLNANAQGELGAFEFPAIEVLDGPRRLVPRTGLAICDPAPSRWQLFGRCPADFAVALDVTAATAAAPARVRLVRAHNDAGAEVIRETEDH